MPHHPIILHLFPLCSKQRLVKSYWYVAIDKLATYQHPPCHFRSPGPDKKQQRFGSPTECLLVSRLNSFAIRYEVSHDTFFIHMRRSFSDFLMRRIKAVVYIVRTTGTNWDSVYNRTGVHSRITFFAFRCRLIIRQRGLQSIRTDIFNCSLSYKSIATPAAACSE